MATLKNWNGLAAASIKSFNGLAAANIKTINGLNFAATDPYWANVVLLALNENGADGGTTFIDASNSAHTLTASGNAQWDTAQAPTGMTSSLLLDGTGDFVTVTGSADLNFGTGDLTIEAMIRANSFPTNPVVLASVGYANSGTGNWLLPRVNATTIQTWAYNAGVTNEEGGSKSATVNTATWYHVAIVRASGTVTIFQSGTSLGTVSITKSLENGASNIFIGHSVQALNGDWNGWMSNLRITKGVARYSSDFTPPTLPMPTS